MAPLLLFLLMAVSYYPAHAAPASPEPPTTEPSTPEPSTADSYPTPLVQLQSSTPLSVPSLPYIDYIRFGRLQNIQSLNNYTDITELYRTAMEIVQTLTHLSGVMVSVWYAPWMQYHFISRQSLQICNVRVYILVLQAMIAVVEDCMGMRLV